MDMIIALAFPLLHLEHFSSAHVDRGEKKSPQSTKINTSVIFYCSNNE